MEENKITWKFRGKLVDANPWTIYTDNDIIDVWSAVERFLKSIDGKPVMHKQEWVEGDRYKYIVFVDERSRSKFDYSKGCIILQTALGAFEYLQVEIKICKGQWLMVTEVKK